MQLVNDILWFFLEPWHQMYTGTKAQSGNDIQNFFLGVHGVCLQLGIAYILYSGYKEVAWWYAFHKERFMWSVMCDNVYQQDIRFERLALSAGCLAFIGLSGIPMRLLQIEFGSSMTDLTKDRELVGWAISAVVGYAMFLVFQHLRRRKVAELKNRRQDAREEAARKERVRDITGQG